MNYNARRIERSSYFDFEPIDEQVLGLLPSREVVTSLVLVLAGRPCKLLALLRDDNHWLQ